MVVLVFQFIFDSIQHFGTRDQIAVLVEKFFYKLFIGTLLVSNGVVLAFTMLQYRRMFDRQFVISTGYSPTIGP